MQKVLVFDTFHSRKEDCRITKDILREYDRLFDAQVNGSPSATGSSLKQALEANAQATYNEYEEDDDEFEFEPIESDDGKIKIRLSDDEKWMYLDFETAGASGPYRENMKANGWRYYAPDRVWSNFPNQENYDYAVGLIEEYNEE